MKATFLALLFLAAAVCTADPVVDRTLTAPDGDITGLGYYSGTLYAVDGTSEYVYCLDPETGDVQSSWECTQTSSRVPTGLTVTSGYVYVAAASGSNQTDPYCYRYNTSGSYVGYFDLDC
jgi:outer membrane protein assembly factor BamB